MKKYILIYNINDWPDMGGGLHFERFETDMELDKRVEEIYSQHEILLTGEVVEYKYKPVETVTKIVRED